ncbi:uncharacterized protein [Physcomitrium patens]|uniref:peptidylprolyl isomerase n=1 Tax=Physcomitrium patens TaxID=3218 RepID=A0A2K1JIJ9_PHYPA|nr:uncharacterized protein LOC112291918 isoform X2 [Physcomitrium patens]PNR41363.1 hypothetical protein PHYPA_018766 [Physcomitrium patens]|eukprot:XP_024395676.1 uncharacterized protein LOC112291918 isoform X2 [Physcomitrella patens]
MAMAAISSTTCTAAPSSTLRLSSNGSGLRSAFAGPQCSCGGFSSALFGAPILRVQRLSGTPRQRGPVQISAVKYEYKSSQNTNDLSQAPLSSGNSNLTLIKDARIEAQPQDMKLKLRVDLTGQSTQKAFDTIVRSLAKNAPPVPGFRKAKGGKTSIVPTSVLLNMMGVSRVRKFVIEEIVRTVLVEYVEQEGIKAKKNLATDKTADELNAIFEPGQEFGFDATLELEDDSADEVAKPEAADASEIEVVGA